MKSCPTCRRTFEDTFSFCLVDGAILSAPFDPEATKARTGVGGDVMTEVLYARDTLPSPTVRSTTQPNAPPVGPAEGQAETLIAQPGAARGADSGAVAAGKKAGPNRVAQLTLGLLPATLVGGFLGMRQLPFSIIASYLGVVLAVLIERKAIGLPAAIAVGFLLGFIPMQAGVLTYGMGSEVTFACTVLATLGWALTRLIGLILRVTARKG